MEQPDPPKRKRGRPSKFEKTGGGCVISVSIEARQKKWLSEIAESSMNESTSALVRDALDLWYRVHVSGQSIDATDQKRYFVGEDRLLAQSWEQSPHSPAPEQPETASPDISFLDDSEAFDLSWPQY